MLDIVGATVTTVCFTPEAIVVGLRLRRRRLTCPCGFTTRAVYDRSRRRWRHLDLGASKLLIEAEIRRLWLDLRLCFDMRVLPDLLERAGVSWKYYATRDAWNNALQAIRHIRFGPMWDNVQPPSRFLVDVEQGRLPSVSWLIPPSIYDEHPGSGKSVCAGENWTVQQVNEIMHSAHWRSTVVVIVWDDFGGFYDPVPPPHLDVMGLGPRTPALIISPYTVQGEEAPTAGTWITRPTSSPPSWPSSKGSSISSP